MNEFELFAMLAEMYQNGNVVQEVPVVAVQANNNNRKGVFKAREEDTYTNTLSELYDYLKECDEERERTMARTKAKEYRERVAHEQTHKAMNCDDAVVNELYNLLKNSVSMEEQQVTRKPKKRVKVYKVART